MNQGRSGFLVFIWELRNKVIFEKQSVNWQAFVLSLSKVEVLDIKVARGWTTSVKTLMFVRGMAAYELVT